MRLAAIEIENFKGFGDRQRLEFRPITLLFGPNSSGKSTVIQALHYVREVLARSNVDPDVTVAGGLLDLGGFLNVVHRHDLYRAVRVKLDVDLSADHGVEELPLNSGMFIEEADFTELQVRYMVGESEQYRDYSIVQAIGVELEVRWSERELAPFVSHIAIAFDDVPMIAIASPPEHGRALLTEFNFAHPLLRSVESPDGGDADTQLAASPLENLLWLFSREKAIDRSNPELPQSEIGIRVGVQTIFGALPNIDHELYLDLRDPEPNKSELEYRTPRVLALRRLLDEIVAGPLRIVRRCVENMTYIGPLRQVLTRAYRPQVSPDEARWAQGLAAWDLLYTVRKNDLITAASRWLSDPDRLNTGYQLERLEFVNIPIPSPFAACFQRGLQEDDLAELETLFELMPREQELFLRELRTGLLVRPTDVGVGLSQLIPVIVAVLAQEKRLVAIEQPELHVHPAIQVALGDLLISGIGVAVQGLPCDRILLIETHSEHLMLRLLRRIRETAENELPPGVPALQPSEVAVIYVETPHSDDVMAGDSAVRFTPIRISHEGEFVDRWPKGFFEERIEEVL